MPAFLHVRGGMAMNASYPELAPWLLAAPLTDSPGAGRANCAQIQVDSPQIRTMPTFTLRTQFLGCAAKMWGAPPPPAKTAPL